MEQGIKPEEILALTFTEKAASEMEERVDKLLPLGYADLWISTFHSFAERVLKDSALEIGLPNDFKLLSQTEQWLLVRQNLDRFKLDYYRPLGNPTKFIHALLKLFSRAKDENISADNYLEYAQNLKLDSDSADFIKEKVSNEDLSQLTKKEILALTEDEVAKQLEIADTYHTYQQLLLEKGAMDFGDLINYCLKLFQERPGVLAQYRNKFKYILVDEFQDTNWAQYELVKLLAAPKNNLTVVGDDDQAIYKFRGASVSNILQFKDDFPKAEEVLLVDNYRSCQNILDLSYKFIQRNNPDRLEIKMSQKGKKLSKQLVSHAECEGQILHLHGQTAADEVETTINKIIEIYNSDKALNWSDFAILVRANNSAEDFCYALELAQVPYVFMASKGLYQKRIVLDILAWFRLLDSYHESSAMYRVINMPIWQLPQSDCVNLNYWANRKGWSLYEVCKQNRLFSNINDKSRFKLDGIVSLLEKSTTLAKSNKKPTELLQEFLESSGYLKALTNKDNIESRRDINYLNQFYKKISKFEKESLSADLESLMMLINMELEAGEEGSLAQDSENDSPDTVKVMTVHGSKGLEFKYVFIANLVDKKFPSISRSEPIDLPTKLVKETLPEGDPHLEEERRLFYVAVTRAKNGIFFTSAQDYGGARSKKLSRFLIELGEDGLSLAQQTVSESVKLEKISDQKRQAQAQINTKIAPPKQFSFTQIKAFENCPYQYRFAHILKIPGKGKPQFSFGKSMHSAMQKFFLLVKSRAGSAQTDIFDDGLQQPEIDWNDLRKIYEESFIDDWYPDKKTKDLYYQKGLISLKNFFDAWQTNKVVADSLEVGFTFKLSKDCSIRGAIDRIDKLSDGYKLVDYKTGNPKEKLTAEDKEQLLIYQMAAQEVLGKPVKELSFYYFDGNKELSFVGSEKELDKLKNKISTIAEDIKSGEFPAKPEKEKCKWCDFKSICDYA
jgi:DNA helicase II / ATP-dependent DNA helicase PcrA